MANILSKFLGRKSFVPVDTSTPSLTSSMPGLVSFYEDTFASHGYIYQSQPSVRTVVDFIARNTAQVGIKLYNRLGDTDRVELSEHPLTKLLNHPNPVTTRYRMVYGTVADLCIYDAAFWVKARTDAGKLGLVRVPPEYMTVYGGMTPSHYQLWFPGGNRQVFTPDEVVHFHGYHPTQLTSGVSPIETLKSIVAEDIAASSHRRGFWNRGARMEGIILRPSSAPDLSIDGKKRFLQEWESMFAGARNAGRTGMLEEDMKWEPASFSPKDSEFIAGRQLTMAQVARAYHVPLPMVGLTDSANFASIKEYHLMLYQETLPPWFTWMQEDLELQLFPEFSGLDKAYLEFNVAEKLRGSFEDQAAILSTSVGAPWMTVPEARARMNLPNDEESLSLLVMPLNVVMGGGEQAAPNEPINDPGNLPNQPALPPGKAASKALAQRVRGKYEVQHEEALKKFFARQREVLLANEKAKRPFDTKRWNKELAEDLLPLAHATTESAGAIAARSFDGTYDPDMTVNYLKDNVERSAENINAQTKRAVQSASDGEALKHVFDVAIGARALQLATSRTTSLVSFATHEAAKQSGKAGKTWVVTNPQSRHPEMDGEVAPLFQAFSNGLQYPGDPAGDAEEIAHCECLLDYST